MPDMKQHDVSRLFGTATGPKSKTWVVKGFSAWIFFDGPSGELGEMYIKKIKE
jgi:hypothetical protein